MKKIFLFDVDGTLTPPRQPITDDFEHIFRAFVQSRPVYLVSGSDYHKLQEQVPQDILDDCQGVFGCSGAEFFSKQTKIYSKDHTFSKRLLTMCEHFIDLSSYSTRTGNHLEFRPGMLNISVVGRNASRQQRAHYHQWDQIAQERQAFANEINAAGLDYEASCGGEISIDIVPRGWNKSVVKNEVINREGDCQLVFFGDRIREGGNDLPLAQALQADGNHQAFAVEGYQQTKAMLEKELSIGTHKAA